MIGDETGLLEENLLRPRRATAEADLIIAITLPIEAMRKGVNPDVKEGD